MRTCPSVALALSISASNFFVLASSFSSSRFISSLVERIKDSASTCARFALSASSRTHAHLLRTFRSSDSAACTAALASCVLSTVAIDKPTLFRTGDPGLERCEPSGTLVPSLPTLSPSKRTSSQRHNKELYRTKPDVTMLMQCCPVQLFSSFIS